MPNSLTQRGIKGDRLYMATSPSPKGFSKLGSDYGNIENQFWIEKRRLTILKRCS